ncbi:MAG: TolC family protein [Roseivirga sp.]|nr:TolC family protein [Roseivirga sp.]
MKKLLAITLLLSSGLSFGQEMPQDEMAMDKIKEVEELIDLAVAYAPGLKVFSTSQDQAKEGIAITQKKWLRHLSLAAGVNYGNGVVADQLTDGSGTDNRITYLSRQNVTYNVGLNIRLPFAELSSRKNEVKIQKLELERLEYLKQDQQNFIREEVVKRYKSLAYCLKAIELQTQVVEANDIALQVAENYFKAGTLPMEQYRMAVDQTYTAKLELERSKNEAWYCFRSLTEIVGQSILK